MCTHHAINDAFQVSCKGKALMQLLHEDNHLINYSTKLSIAFIILSERFKCICGYKSENEPIELEIWQRETTRDNRSLTRSISDYCFLLVHTEEKEYNVYSSTMVCNPHAVTKNDMNIDKKDNIFFCIVTIDIEVQGLLMPGSKSDMVRLLKNSLVIWYTLQCYRGALMLYEISLKDQLLDPGQCHPCVLHHKKSLLKRWFSSYLSSSHCVTDFVECVRWTVNCFFLP
jgi:hypothetical protein